MNSKLLREKKLEEIVKELNYVRVGKKWNYVCLILDMLNREIIGYYCGENKDEVIVKKEFRSIKKNMKEVEIFNNDSGKEFDKKDIDELLKNFEINR